MLIFEGVKEMPFETIQSIVVLGFLNLKMSHGKIDFIVFSF